MSQYGRFSRAVVREQRRILAQITLDIQRAEQQREQREAVAVRNLDFMLARLQNRRAARNARIQQREEYETYLQRQNEAKDHARNAGLCLDCMRQKEECDCIECTRVVVHEQPEQPNYGLPANTLSTHGTTRVIVLDQ